MEIYNNNFEEKKESNEISDRLKGYISNYFDGCQVYTHKAKVADDKYLVGKQSSSSDEDIIDNILELLLIHQDLNDDDGDDEDGISVEVDGDDGDDYCW